MADEEGKQEEQEQPKKSSKKLIIIVLIVVLLATIGGTFAFLNSGGDHEEELEIVEEEEHGELEDVDVGTFIVNLSENATFLKTSITVECDAELLHSEEAEGGGEEEKDALPGILGVKEAKVKDAIIRVLSSKKAPQLLGLDGKEELREELIDAINEALETEEPVVKDLFFTHFIIQ